MAEPKIKQARPRSDHRLKIWLTYALAAAALAWVCYDIKWTSLVDQVQQLSWGWVALIIGFDVLSFYVQGVRWGVLLQPIASLPYLKTTQAIYIGLFASEVLPLRAGEIIRGVLIARWVQRKFHDVLPSMALERLFDGIWFSGAMILTAMLIDVPPQIRIGTNIVLALSLTGIAICVWVMKRTHFAEAAPKTVNTGAPLKERIALAVYEVRMGLKQIGTGRRFWTAFGVSGLLHVVQALAFLAVLQACSIDLPLLPMIAVFLVVHLGIAIPNAPANVGTFQLFCVLGLTFFGIDKSAAAAFSLVAFAILTIPVLFIGMAATLHAGFMLSGVRSQLRQAEEAI